MTDSYSYTEDLKRHRREKKRRKLAQDRKEERTLEPRKYTARDEAFASRLKRGFDLMTGGAE